MRFVILYLIDDKVKTYYYYTRLFIDNKTKTKVLQVFKNVVQICTKLKKCSGFEYLIKHNNQPTTKLEWNTNNIN